jgi:ankyrin repeat protein
MVRLLLDLGADANERTLLTDNEEPVESWGMPLWHAARTNDYEAAKLLLDRGADPNANVYASGWPLGHAWNHADGRVKNLLLDRGARATPYMVAQFEDVAEARRLLDAQPNDDELANELAWSSASGRAQTRAGIGFSSSRSAPPAPIRTPINRSSTASLSY